MKKNIVIFICFCFCFVTCKQADIKKQASCVLVINNVKQNDPILYSSIFKNLDIVPLETNDICLISRITSMRYEDNKFFIFDSDQETIFIFDNKGGFINKIRKRGGGPGEYTTIGGFDVDSKNKLICLSSRNKLIYYDYQGTFIKDEPMTKCNDLILSDKYVLAYTGFMHSNINGKERDCMLVVKDRETSVIKGYIPFDMQKIGGTYRTYQQSKAFARFKDEILFFYPLSNDVYVIKGDSVSIKYTLNFGENKENNLPYDYFDKFKTPDDAFDNLRNTNYAYGFNSCWENKWYFSIDVLLVGNLLNCMYDKAENKLKVGYYSDDMGADPRITDVTDEYSVGFKDVCDIIESVEYKKQHNKKINEKISELLTHVDEDSNPVIFLYYFK